jgi:hypothetical protein
MTNIRNEEGAILTYSTYVERIAWNYHGKFFDNISKNSDKIENCLKMSTYQN